MSIGISGERIVQGLGAIKFFGRSGVICGEPGNGIRAFESLSLGQLRDVAKIKKVGSGIWRAGARKADLIAAFEAVAEGREFDFAVAAPGLVEHDDAAAAELAAAEINDAAVLAADGKAPDHKSMKALLRCLKAGVPVYLAGPAGSGKTTGVAAAAEALGLKFYFRSVGLQTSEVSLLGYMNASGEYVSTPLRQAFEHGGVFLLDEIDAGSPHVLVVLNSLIANNEASFPDRMVKAHADFRFVGAGNTYGSGASREFVGRQQLDAATLDRFAFMDWSYDINIERIAMGLKPRAAEVSEYEIGEEPRGAGAIELLLERWFERVQVARRKVADLGLRHMVTPRASINGAKLLRAGVKFDSVEKLLLRKGLDDAGWNRLK